MEGFWPEVPGSPGPAGPKLQAKKSQFAKMQFRAPPMSLPRARPSAKAWRDLGVKSLAACDLQVKNFRQKTPIKLPFKMMGAQTMHMLTTVSLLGLGAGKGAGVRGASQQRTC